MFGFWNTARANKESILYTIVTIVLLERVRTAFNRAETAGRNQGHADAAIRRRQKTIVVKSAFLYALLPLLPVVKYIYRSIEELSWSVPSLIVMKNTAAFVTVTIAVELFLAFVAFQLLRIYVERMNAAIGFFTKIGRNIWDGSKVAVQLSGDVGNRVAGSVRTAASSTLNLARPLARVSMRGVSKMGRMSRSTALASSSAVRTATSRTVAVPARARAMGNSAVRHAEMSIAHLRRVAGAGITGGRRAASRFVRRSLPQSVDSRAS